MIVEERYITFINRKMKSLEDYDALRPVGHAYEFHLHSERVAQLMKSLALKTGYTKDMADALYWATLPHDIGKIALPVSIWDKKERPTSEESMQRRTHTLKGVEVVQDEFRSECATAPFLRLMVDIMLNHHEAMDGKGFLGKNSNDLTREVRMACICDAFDGWSVRRPGFSEDRDLSPQGVITRMEVEKAGQFDPDLLKSFKELVLCQ